MEHLHRRTTTACRRPEGHLHRHDVPADFHTSSMSYVKAVFLYHIGGRETDPSKQRDVLRALHQDGTAKACGEHDHDRGRAAG